MARRIRDSRAAAVSAAGEFEQCSLIAVLERARVDSDSVLDSTDLNLEDQVEMGPAWMGSGRCRCRCRCSVRSNKKSAGGRESAEEGNVGFVEG